MPNEDIVVHKLCKSFGDKVVFSGFCARFPHGEKSGVLAASGKGKTTFFRILLGLENPDSGTVHGMEGRKIACVFQEDRLCQNLSAMVNIAIASNACETTIQEGLCEMGLANDMHAPVCTLSGGMKRRVAILRALLSNADLLLLDEPFKGLDQGTKQMVMEQVLHHAKGKTLILVSHLQEEHEALGIAHNIEL